MIRPLYNLYHNLFVKHPKPFTINRSGIILSDHPVIGNGWIKGWLVDNSKKDTIIVCKHSNPSTFSPNNIVFATSNNGTKHYRTIVSVENVELNNHDLDITVCKLDKPFPKDIHAYKFAEKLQEGQYTITFNNSNERSEANLKLMKKSGQVAGNNRKLHFISGDSGTPWFVWEQDEWRVASHTHRGMWGIGPWYSYKALYSKLKNQLLKNYNVIDK